MYRLKIFFIILITLIINSCSSSNINVKNTKKDKSSNDFLAYYNTFYTAEQSFNKAIDLIDSQYEDVNSKIPAEALNLLDISIKNSLIILEDFYNSS